MTKDEALKLALEVLEEPHPGIRTNFTYAITYREKVKQAITAVKEALAQQEQKQEPKCGAIIEVFGKDWRLEYMSLPVGKHKLYTQQYTYTTPPQRKPTEEMVVAAARVLSDRQAAACNVDCGDMWKLHGNDFIEDARAALEAAHGIKE